MAKGKVKNGVFTVPPRVKLMTIEVGNIDPFKFEIIEVQKARRAIVRLHKVTSMRFTTITNDTHLLVWRMPDANLVEPNPSTQNNPI